MVLNVVARHLSIQICECGFDWGFANWLRNRSCALGSKAVYVVHLQLHNPWRNAGWMIETASAFLHAFIASAEELNEFKRYSVIDLRRNYFEVRSVQLLSVELTFDDSVHMRLPSEPISLNQMGRSGCFFLLLFTKNATVKTLQKPFDIIRWFMWKTNMKRQNHGKFTMPSVFLCSRNSSDVATIEIYLLVWFFYSRDARLGAIWKRFYSVLNVCILRLFRETGETSSKPVVKFETGRD